MAKNTRLASKPALITLFYISDSIACAGPTIIFEPWSNDSRIEPSFEKVKSELGIKALHRELEQVDGTYALREW